MTNLCGALTQSLPPLGRGKLKALKTRGCVKSKREYLFPRPCIAAHFVAQYGPAILLLGAGFYHETCTVVPVEYTR